MSEPPTVLIWVTHLLGTGHLFRTAAIVRALRRRRARVVVASGGVPVGGVNFADAEVVQLPPIRSPDASYMRLVDAEGRIVDTGLLLRRETLLADLVRAIRPHVLVTELFPFGRRKLRAEVDRMLEEASALTLRPAIVASVRDILEPPANAAQVEHAVSRLRRHYDMVLVHGDPEFVRLEESFPLPSELKSLLRYTGYVAAGPGVARTPDTDPVTGEVIVSAGGGEVGMVLYEAALEAAATPAGGQMRWRILVGHKVDEVRYRRLAQRATANVAVERARADFPRLLRLAAVSVSQAGYNTTADLLDAGVPAVVVPFAEGGEVEQTMRARLLAAAGRAVVVDPAALSGKALVEAVEGARKLPHRAAGGPAMNGSLHSADLILDAAAGAGADG